MSGTVRVDLSDDGRKPDGVVGGMGGGFEQLEGGPTSRQGSLNERAI